MLLVSEDDSSPTLNEWDLRSSGFGFGLGLGQSLPLSRRQIGSESIVVLNLGEGSSAVRYG